MWNNENEAREQIKALVAEYYHCFKEKKDDFKPGDRVNYGGRAFDEREMLALTDAALDFWLTTGRFSVRFEREFAAFMGVRFAHIVNSGSSANLLAFMALTAPELEERQIRPGDEVITVACAFPTTVAPIIQYGAVPVFVDVTIPQYNIDVTKLEAADGADFRHWPEIREMLNRHCGYRLAADEVILFRIGEGWYFMADIGLRMLTPRELYRAQGFPDDYIIDRDASGKAYPKNAQVARCGNAVPPPFATALVRANFPEWCAGEITSMRELAEAVAV